MIYPLLAVLTTLSWNSQVASTDLEAVWRREYPAAVARLEEASRKFTSSGILTRRSLTGKTILTKNITLIRDQDRKVLIRDNRIVQGTNEPFNSDVLCTTDEHVFRLVKPQGVGPWVVEAFTLPSNWETLAVQFELLFDLYVEAAYSVMGISFFEKTRETSFCLEKIERISRSGESLIRIDYSMGTGDEAEAGTVLLDPRKDWAIRECDVEAMVKYPGDGVVERQRHHMQVDYFTRSEGFFPERIHFVTRTPKPEVFEEMLLEFDEIRLGEVDEERFQLTAYGLPDIPLTPAPRPPSLFSLRNPIFWASLLVAIAAFTLHRTLQRRTESASH
ncbi:hypothetical protein AB1L88_00020 [Tautonia sp. JC769]|uniref:hypothetical protein n=1 Tax=Tautonia sp. JC769 TaxID=3232135 RepID=UPI00345A2AD1